jgi:P4 family phage/plasmid primase-like protien
MIQIIAYRDYFDNHQQKWSLAHKLLLETRFESVSVMLQNLDEVLNEIPKEEHYNLHYTTANCYHAPRQFKSQTLVPIDIDDIEETSLDGHIAVISETLNIPSEQFIQVSSGHGLHLLFEVDKEISSSEELSDLKQSYKTLCNQIQAALKASSLSGKLDPAVFRVSGTLRLPGTINRCPKGKAIQYEDTNCVLLNSNYKLHSFSNLLGEAATTQAGESIDSSSLRAFPTPDSEYILKECKFLEWNFTSPTEVSEPEWYAALSIVGHLDNGNKLAHTMSSGHPGYSHKDTESKLAKAMAASGPRTCQNIDSISDKCRACPHYNKVTSPILLKGPDYIKTAGSGFWEIGPDKNGIPKPIKPAYEDLRRYFQKKYQYVCTPSGTVWIYEAPLWRELESVYVEAFAQDNFVPKPSNSNVQEFLALILRTNVVSEDWFDKQSENKINLANGVIDVITHEFTAHDKKYGFKYCLPFEYSPTATSPVFDNFLAEITVGRTELQNVLMEYMAYSISGMPYIYHKALMLSGEGSNGKSTFLSVLKKLAGPQAYSSIMLNELNQEYKRAYLVGKLFNVAEETPVKSLDDSSWFKVLSAGGSYMAREIYKKPINVVSNKTKLVMACNELPEMSDFSEGFIRRLIIVPFDAYFGKGKADPKIEEKLSFELPGIFNQVLKAHKRLVDQNGFSSSEVIDQTISDYRMDQNTVCAWFDEKVIMTQNERDFIPVRDCYVDYVAWCGVTKTKHESVIKFGKDLSRFYKIKSIQRKDSGKNLRGFEKIKFALQANF